MSTIEDIMIGELDRRADQSELAAKAHKRRRQPVDLFAVSGAERDAEAYRRVANEIRQARQSGCEIEYQADGQRRKMTFRVRDDGVWRTEYEFDDGRWRKIGSEPVENVRIR